MSHVCQLSLLDSAAWNLGGQNLSFLLLKIALVSVFMSAFAFCCSTAFLQGAHIFWSNLSPLSCGVLPEVNKASTGKIKVIIFPLVKTLFLLIFRGFFFRKESQLPFQKGIPNNLFPFAHTHSWHPCKQLRALVPTHYYVVANFKGSGKNLSMKQKKRKSLDILNMRWHDCSKTLYWCFSFPEPPDFSILQVWHHEVLLAVERN